MKKLPWLRALAAALVTASALAVAPQAGAAPTPLTPDRSASAQRAATDPSVAATCSYSTNTSQGFTFNNDFYVGRGYAGHYSGLTAVPSTSVVTSAGVEAQCLLVRYGDYNPGVIDGVFGRNSRAAMTQFQQDMNSLFGAGLSTDGLPGPQTWKWLRWWEQ
jgi:hypothetical protein